MRRRILALLTACAAAPYLTVLFMLIADLSYGGGPGIKSPLDLLKAVPLGTFALLLLGLPLVCGASLLAFVLHGRRWERRWHLVLAACVLGSCFVRLMFSDELNHLLEGGLAGAICGWIYWRIAIKRTPANSHAIDPA